MKKWFSVLLFTSNMLWVSPVFAEEDKRQWVKMPEKMQQHMLADMRDHLSVINQILQEMGKGELDHAAEIAERRIGMSSLKSHNAGHRAKFMPKGMQEVGTQMHRSASRFALKAQEGEPLEAYRALSKVTTACVACHTSYRIR